MSIAPVLSPPCFTQLMDLSCDGHELGSGFSYAALSKREAWKALSLRGPDRFFQGRYHLLKAQSHTGDGRYQKDRDQSRDHAVLDGRFAGAILQKGEARPHRLRAP